MSKTHQIVLLSGDGIGPESWIRRAGDARRGRPLSASRWRSNLPMGGAACGRVCRRWPTRRARRAWEPTRLSSAPWATPSSTARRASASPRRACSPSARRWGWFANLRPAKVWPGLEHVGPLRPRRAPASTCSSCASSRAGSTSASPRIEADGSSAVNTLRVQRREIERIVVVGFEARAPAPPAHVGGQGERARDSQLWRAVRSRAPRYPRCGGGTTCWWTPADMLALDPKRFDVIVTENLFGATPLRQAGAVAGSLGMLPSACPGRGPRPLRAGPRVGPDGLPGRDQAKKNPIGGIGSGAMLLRHSLGRADAADAIRAGDWRGIGRGPAHGRHRPGRQAPVAAPPWRAPSPARVRAAWGSRQRPAARRSVSRRLHYHETGGHGLGPEPGSRAREDHVRKVALAVLVVASAWIGFSVARLDGGGPVQLRQIQLPPGFRIPSSRAA